MNRAVRFYIYLASMAAIGVLSDTANISYWIYFPMMGGLIVLGVVYVGKEE